MIESSRLRTAVISWALLAKGHVFHASQHDATSTEVLIEEEGALHALSEDEMDQFERRYQAGTSFSLYLRT